MTKQQIMTEAEEWLRTPNRAVELYKRGEPTFEVDATSHEDLNRFRSVLMSIPDLELLALVKLEGHNSPLCVWINDLDESRDEFEDLRSSANCTKRSSSATLDLERALLLGDLIRRDFFITVRINLATIEPICRISEAPHVSHHLKQNPLPWRRMPRLIRLRFGSSPPEHRPS